MAAFLEGRIGFLDIPASVAATLERAGVQGSVGRAPADLEEVAEIDLWSRKVAEELVSSR